MRRETEISIAILVVGFIVIALYWLQDKTLYSRANERIVLPSESSEYYATLPEVKAYRDEVKRLIAKGQAVVPLQRDELDKKSVRVQEFLLNNRTFLADTVTPKGELLHNDMMTIRPAIVSVMSQETQRLCRVSSCYEALKYNYVTNTTTRAIVDAKSLKLLELKRFRGMQPDISLRLRKIAQAIALNSPKVKEELKGEEPSIKEMSMANVRGSLNYSPCENKNHLCVAPTLSYHDREEALWAIVDLTDLKLTSAKWAGLGKSTTPACISERAFQNREIMEKYCKRDTTYSKDGWSLKYRITGSDGLEIIDATFKGDAILKSAKIVDWHVAYRGRGELNLDELSDSYVAGRQLEYVKGNKDEFYFGYNDAMGCPMFSTSVVLAFNIPQIKSIIRDKREVGFSISQDFRNPKWPMACNYRYENRFEFYRDGSFRVVGVNIGRGCGENAIYRPVMRIDMSFKDDSFFKYDGSWKRWLVEGEDFQREAKSYFENRYLYRVGGYYIEPNRGQFNDNSRGDNATLFVTKFKEEEGSKELLTLGSCCKLDEDGVERYLDKHESIEGEDIVIWYVPRIKNDAREGHEYCWADTRLENGELVVKKFPCSVGPMFVPVEYKE